MHVCIYIKALPCCVAAWNDQQGDEKNRNGSRSGRAWVALICIYDPGQGEKDTHTHTYTRIHTHTHTHDVAENNKEGKERLLVFSSSSSFWFSLLLVFPIYIFSSTFPSFSYPLFHLYSIPRIPQHTLCIYIKFLEVFTRKIFLLAYNY